MNLLIDIGNTTIRIMYNESREEYAFTISCDKKAKSDEIKARFLALIPSKLIECDIKGVILSSVVPELTEEVKEAFESIHRKPILVVSKGVKNGLSLKVDNPSEVGSDIIADCVGAKQLFGYPLVVVNLGTATKLVVLDKEGNFVGASFLPGLRLAASSLSANASLLPNVDLSLPRSVIGKNTIDSLNSGLVYGHAFAIEGLIKKMESELGYPLKRILTGGNSKKVLKILERYNYVFAPSLTFVGLSFILEKNYEKKN